MGHILNAQIHFIAAVIAEKAECSAVNPDKLYIFQLIQIFVHGIQKCAVPTDRKDQIGLPFLFRPAFLTQFIRQLAFQLPGCFIGPVNDRKLLFHTLSRFLRFFPSFNAFHPFALSCFFFTAFRLLFFRTFRLLFCRLSKLCLPSF